MCTIVGQQRALDPVELELHMVVIFHEGDDFLTQLLWQEQVLFTAEHLSSQCLILYFWFGLGFCLLLHYIIFLYRIPVPQVSNVMML